MSTIGLIFVSLANHHSWFWIKYLILQENHMGTLLKIVRKAKDLKITMVRITTLLGSSLTFIPWTNKEIQDSKLNTSRFYFSLALVNIGPKLTQQGPTNKVHKNQGFENHGELQTQVQSCYFTETLKYIKVTSSVKATQPLSTNLSTKNPKSLDTWPGVLCKPVHSPLQGPPGQQPAKSPPPAILPSSWISNH
jgi:hypothetical protein